VASSAKFIVKKYALFTATLLVLCVPHQSAFYLIFGLLTQELFQDIDHAEEWEALNVVGY
jgi:hypothetical protein